MMIDEVRQADVVDGKTFAVFCQQNFGSPYATVKDQMILNKKAKELFKNHPGTDWQTLVSVARWCASKKRRIARVYTYVDQFRWAWADGAIMIEPLRDAALEKEVSDVLKTETDPVWRARIMKADGTKATREVIERWRAERHLSM